MAAWQDRAAFAPPLGDGDRRFIFHRDDGLSGAERLWPFGRQVLFGVVRIDLFHHHILIIDIGRGEAPTQLIRPAHQHQGHAGDGAANDAASGQLQPRQIPDRRRG